MRSIEFQFPSFHHRPYTLSYIFTSKPIYPLVYISCTSQPIMDQFTCRTHPTLSLSSIYSSQIQIYMHISFGGLEMCSELHPKEIGSLNNGSFIDNM